jgi:prepilin-type N-terminal cleavage/methylation domain-containing protein
MRLATPSPIARRPRRGFSLIEAMVVVAIMGVLFAMALPTFGRAVEQAQADIAAANLRALWAAERLYWLDNRVYTADLSALQSLGLIDPTLLSSSNYTYAVSAPDAATFTATATRAGSAKWSGTLAIDQNGAASGSITAAGENPITPGFQ